MKTQIRNFRTLVMTALTVLAVTFSTAILANKANTDTTGIELKFIGNIKNQPVFQLSLNNVETEEFTITIRDWNNDVLYSSRVNGKNISRKFQLNKEVIEDGRVWVEVKAKNTRTAEVYEINSTLRYVQENVVTKL